MNNQNNLAGNIHITITPAVFDRKQFAAYLGVSVPTIRRWEKEGNCPPGFKISGKVFFRRGHVESWLDAKSDEPRDLGDLGTHSA